MSDGIDAAGWQYDDLEHTVPEAYERYLVPVMFAPWADELVERADVRCGDRALDVGCGTGIVARRAAALVGDEGTVVGLDPNEDMLDVARERATGAEQPIDWRTGDASDLPFPDDSFDVVFYQQVIQFLENPSAALREAHRVLAPDGRLAIRVWRPVEYSPVGAALGDALGRTIDDDLGAAATDPFPDWDGETLRTLVREAGFRDVTVTIDIESHRFESPEAFLRQAIASTPLVEPVGAAGEAARDALVRTFSEAVEAYTDDEGLVDPAETYVVTARA